jgi:hypothetical protein
MMGILLSTPLTVCLAVLGKYVPSLGVFATLLGEEAELEPDMRFYQRLVALDADGAVDVVDAALKSKPRAEVFDSILVPALSHAERDANEGYLAETDVAFVRRVVGEIVDDLQGVPEITLESVSQAQGHGQAQAERAAGPGPRPNLVGVAANDTGDALVLNMVAQLLAPLGLEMEIISDAPSPLALAERVAAAEPSMVVLSHLPPEGLAPARYQVRRLRARFADLPILVGRWGASGNVAAAAQRLSEMGASHVSFGLADARDYIAAKLAPAPEPPTAVPEAAGDLVKVGS